MPTNLWQLKHHHKLFLRSLLPPHSVYKPVMNQYDNMRITLCHQQVYYHQMNHACIFLKWFRMNKFASPNKCFICRWSKHDFFSVLNLYDNMRITLYPYKSSMRCFFFVFFCNEPVWHYENAFGSKWINIKLSLIN